MKSSITFLLLLFALQIFSQSLNGTWKGRGVAGDEEAYVELKLTLTDSIVTGESFLVATNNRFQRFQVEGIFRQADSFLVLKEIKLLDVKKGFMDINCYSTYSLYLRRSNSGYLLTGTADCVSRGLIKLKSRGHKFDFTRDEKQDMDTIQQTVVNDLDPARTFIQTASQRPEYTIKTLQTNMETLKVSIYDNGEIDGDTVSLLFNENVIAHRVGLGNTAAIYELQIDKTRRVNKLLFIAHNLGSLPPNTGTLSVVIDGKIHRISFSADMNKNAALEFIWVP